MDDKSVLMQLDRIFSHDLFRSSRRSVGFLDYVCRKTLNGEVEQIKEYSIAVDAFGLNQNFDQQLNPRIRVEAKRLRDRLEQYYRTDGRYDDLIITLPKGSYIPEFRLREETSTTSGSVGAPEEKGRYLFDFGCPILEVRLFRSPGSLFDRYDYLQMELLRQLYVRSSQNESIKDNGKSRISAQIIYSRNNNLPGFHVVLSEPETGGIIASSLFSFSGDRDFLLDEKTLCRLADYIISYCQLKK